MENNPMTLEMGEPTVSETANNLVDEIKKLSHQDRAAIVVEVLDTLEEEGEEFDDEELRRELERREAEGMTNSVPWSTLRDML
jgi:putative addiction module component (TIGR02574 family)